MQLLMLSLMIKAEIMLFYKEILMDMVAIMRAVLVFSCRGLLYRVVVVTTRCSQG